MASKSAKAWTYTAGYESLKLSTIKPPTFTDFERERNGTPHMLVQIHACALNPVDIQMMNLPSWNLPWNALYGEEKGCVCDFSGTVLSASRESGFQGGDEIFGLTLQPYAPNGGALGEIADISMSTCVAAQKPKEWSHEKASAISLVWLTAKRCVEAVEQYVEGSKNKRLAVLGGSSAAGIYSIILAKQKGWTVATTSSSRNKDFCLNDLKVDTHVDYTSQNVRQAMSEFAPDAVIDCVGGTECIGLPTSWRYISIVGDKTGRSSMGGPYTYYDYLAPHRAAIQWARWLKGSVGLGESYDVVVLSMKKEWLDDATETLAEKDIYVDSVYSFDKANEAFERLNTGRARGKVVVKVAEPHSSNG
ncbi:zinc ion binding [Vermiconidia calcicola]|uniref:Zinc ion binding n=1 Tax=Vermiconidia calcicola TaxID=1690605 RepID=A0ACC3MYN2_9PEZI|nr:zinc ion binding [Vermiconidia calcicola]